MYNKVTLTDKKKLERTRKNLNGQGEPLTDKTETWTDKKKLKVTRKNLNGQEWKLNGE